MPTAKLHDTELYYEVYGRGRPLLFLSGLGGVGSYWKAQLPVFSTRFRVILHDHRGTGLSERSLIDYSVEQMAGDTFGLMDALGIDTADLVGHSTGAAIAQIMAVTHPDRLGRIVMASAWTKADGFFRRCLEVRRDLLMRVGLEAYRRATPIFLHPSWWIRDHIEELEEIEAVASNGEHDRVIMNSRLEALLRFDWTARLGEIDRPVLVLGSRNDHLTPAYFSQELAALIPTAKLVLMEDGAHAASQTLPDAFNRIVLNFLTEGDVP